MPPTAPPTSVLAAFNLSTEHSDLITPIQGGQGYSYRVDDAIILKPIDDTVETEWVSALTDRLLTSAAGFASPPGSGKKLYALAAPLRAAHGRYVVDGWSASRVLPGTPLPDWMRILRASRAFHADLRREVDRCPAFIGGRWHRWERADRVAWACGSSSSRSGTEYVPVAELRHIYARLLAMRNPVNLSAGSGREEQLVHGDIAGNVLLPDPRPEEEEEEEEEEGKEKEGAPPGIIDLSLYWRPVEYAEAIMVADGLLWYGEGEGLVRLVGTDEFRLQMLVRALVFRLVASSEYAAPGAGAATVEMGEVKALERTVELVSLLMLMRDNNV